MFCLLATFFICINFFASIVVLFSVYIYIYTYLENETIRKWHLPFFSGKRQTSICLLQTRVSSETSSVSKQPKLEPKLISELSETRYLFRLFRFNIETGDFSVLKQPKQTKDQPKQQQIC